MVGRYPCCGAPLMLAFPAGALPRFAPDTCEACGGAVWHRFSRVDPESWTDAVFRAAFEVDDEAKTIKPREAGS